MRVGIYGGSFSPPHLGHVRLAETFLSSLELDKLIIIPAGTPPHKMIDGGANGAERIEMCRAAFSGISENVVISDYEAYRTDPCYTVDTLRHFSGKDELFMLCGSDMFLTLDRWRDPEGIFSLCTVVCGTRADDEDTRNALEDAKKRYLEVYGKDTVIMNFDPIEVSSTEVRASLKCGVRPDTIGDEVFDIIKRLGLYGYRGESSEKF